MSFDTLGLAPALLPALQQAGFAQPTPVQAAAIPQALAGHDLMVSSQTGSGKTAAFMLPALHRIAGHTGAGGRGVQVLVLTPTRELAMQVHDAARLYAGGLPGLRTATVVGGMPYGAQLRALSRRVDVLVATPGRLIDHLQARRVDLSTVHTLVLDEADRMLDMGFIEDIEAIVERTPATRQTLLFSATLDGSVARLAAGMMREPQRIEISGHREQHANIAQSLLYADDAAHKHRLLDHLLRDAALNQAIVFTSTKRGADELAGRLAEQGFPAASLHGDMNQRQRTRTLAQLQRGNVRVLVATDVAARGIDVQGISHAVNFDLPLQAEDYVHRIGRTGRAGRDGQAITLATHAERHKVRRIEQYIGRPIQAEVIAGLEPKYAPRPEARGGYGRGKPGGGKPGAGKRFSGPRREGGWAPREGVPARAPRAYGDGANAGHGSAGAGRDFRADRPQRGFDGAREGGANERRGGHRPFDDRPRFDNRQDAGARRDGYAPRREGGFGERAPQGERAPREGGWIERDARPAARRADGPRRFDSAPRTGNPYEKRPGGPAKRFAKPAARRG